MRGIFQLLKPNAKHIVFFIYIYLLSFTANAQPGGPDQGDCDVPGSGGPDSPCPLDTWVILLVAIALISTTLYLYRKQKTAINF